MYQNACGNHPRNPHLIENRISVSQYELVLLLILVSTELVTPYPSIIQPPSISKPKTKDNTPDTNQVSRIIIHKSPYRWMQIEDYIALYLASHICTKQWCKTPKHNSLVSTYTMEPTYNVRDNQLMYHMIYALHDIMQEVSYNQATTDNGDKTSDALVYSFDSFGIEPLLLLGITINLHITFNSYQSACPHRIIISTKTSHGNSRLYIHRATVTDEWVIEKNPPYPYLIM